ncbi:MAG: 3-hydroxyacyl-CoA dehydrogenase NAD-binding domain-containing protein [Pseudomonadota bacterium]
MGYADPKSVTRVASLGAGPIGGGWTAHFLARGYDVTAYIHDPSEQGALMAVVETGWRSLTELGLAAGASLDRLTVTCELDEALDGAGFVQESGPERLDIKQALYAQMGDMLPPDIVIGSSTSGLTMTDIQATCAAPERCVIGHPFNPPYLLPLVEIVGGKKTDPVAVDWAAAFYEIAGKAPLVMKKEVPGFVGTRLQEALWREALHMVANGEATPEDIDIALKNGPAPRMMVQGQCMAFHVACGEGGMATNLDQFGPALKWPWTRLEAPELTQELRDRMVDGCNAMAGTRHFEDMAAERDRKIVAVLNALNSKP